jgi:hypothetical protein
MFCAGNRRGELAGSDPANRFVRDQQAGKKGEMRAAAGFDIPTIHAMAFINFLF